MAREIDRGREEERDEQARVPARLPLRGFVPDDLEEAGAPRHPQRQAPEPPRVYRRHPRASGQPTRCRSWCARRGAAGGRAQAPARKLTRGVAVGQKNACSTAARTPLCSNEGMAAPEDGYDKMRSERAAQSGQWKVFGNCSCRWPESHHAVLRTHAAAMALPSPTVRRRGGGAL